MKNFLLIMCLINNIVLSMEESLVDIAVHTGESNKGFISRREYQKDCSISCCLYSTALVGLFALCSGGVTAASQDSEECQILNDVQSSRDQNRFKTMAFLIPVGCSIGGFLWGGHLYDKYIKPHQD